MPTKVDISGSRTRSPESIFVRLPETRQHNFSYPRPERAGPKGVIAGFLELDKAGDLLDRDPGQGLAPGNLAIGAIRLAIKDSERPTIESPDLGNPEGSVDPQSVEY